MKSKVSARELLQDYIDGETLDKVIAVIDSLPDFTPSEKPREKLAYCSLEDVANFIEAGI